MTNLSICAEGCFILNADGEAEACFDIKVWSEWMEANRLNRHVHDEKIGEARVSTVFLGLDHGFGGITQLWETMVFGGFLDGEQNRYATKEQASDGHHKMAAEVRESMQ